MQFKLSALAALFAAVATAQDTAELVSKLPMCSVSCLGNGADAVGCTVTDFDCMCGKMQQITAIIPSCLLQSCTEEQVKTVISVTGEICAQYPSANGTSSGAASASGGKVAAATKAVGTSAAKASGASSNNSTGSAIPTGGSTNGNGTTTAATTSAPSTVATAGAFSLHGANSGLLAAAVVAAGAMML